MGERIITFGIVEDEAIERDAMQLFIESSFQDACVLWQAEDGQSGLEAWKANPPHILIIDIHMPIMDGLDLCEQLNQLQCESVIVINTAYDSFAYAKRAITLRAFDYIVKPADNAELQKTLSGCMAEARRRMALKRRTAESTQAMRSLGHLAVAQMVNHPKEAMTSTQHLEPMGWPENQNYQTRVIHYLSPTALDTEHMHALEATLQIFASANWLVASDFVSPNHMIALVDPQEFTNPQKAYSLLWMYGKYYARRSHLFIRISDLCSTKESIAQECAWTPQKHLSQQLEMPRRNWKILRTAESEKLVHTLQRFFFDRQFTRAIRYLEAIRQTYDDLDLEWELIQWVFLAIFNVWPDQNVINAAAAMYRPEHKHGDNLKALIRFCEELPAQDTGDVIDRALFIMKNEFSGDISQSNLANRLGLDQGYFSRLFKKRCGRNFSEVLTEIRMQHAETMLLSNPSISLDDLCRECGLSSKTYFSEVFKKWKGMTITQFLKMHLE